MYTISEVETFKSTTSSIQSSNTKWHRFVVRTGLNSSNFQNYNKIFQGNALIKSATVIFPRFNFGDLLTTV